MGLKINSYDGKWDLTITGEEVWEFETREELESCLKKLLDLKEKYQKIKGAKK